MLFIAEADYFYEAMLCNGSSTLCARRSVEAGKQALYEDKESL